MNKIVLLLGFALVVSAQAGRSPPVQPAAPPPQPSAQDLSAIIIAQDSAMFDAFNHCDKPGQLERYASHFAPGLEFYHDQGGVTWTRDAMVGNTRKNVCGQYRRELVAGSVRVYPIKDFGAIEQGAHLFCHFGTGRCEGIADFVIVWHRSGDRWLATRVLSYGHRENVAAR